MSNARFGLRTRSGQISDLIQGIGLVAPLLDLFPNAAAAYSLRKLRTAYTGSVIRVRRSSDNAEQDIGFDSFDNLDTSTLSTFVGANNGFVTTWYDQSGNGYDATQATAANQPQIVSSGSVISKGIRPSLDFNGTSNHLFYNSNFLGGSAGSGFAVSSFDNATRAAREIIYGMQDTSGARYDFLIARQSSSFVTGAANGIDFYVEGNFEAASLEVTQVTDTNQKLYSNIYEDSIIRKTYINSAEGFSGGSSLGNLDDGTDFYIGADIVNSSWIDGKIQEIVIYGTNQSLNRTGIETNINDYYAIY